MIVLRACCGLEELEACVQLQIDVWGYADGDVIPRRVFLVAQKIGGQVIGAFDTELSAASPDGDASSLVGFAFSLPGIKPAADANARPVSYLHSHMLAVREGYRNSGIGRRLKLAQRDDALLRGIRRMEWTFDPLEIKNAFLNIRKLGAIVRRYEPNFYGSSSSRLQGGLPTDRLVAEWYMDSPRVVERLSASGANPSLPGAAQANSDTLRSITVPASIYQWKTEESMRPLAAEVQTRNRELLQEAFRSGFAIVDYRLESDGSGQFLLDRWMEPLPQQQELDKENLGLRLPQKIVAG